MNYMTPQEAAEKWGVCLRQVQYFCNNNRIPGVLHVSRRWLIPVNAQRPVDARKGHTKRSEKNDTYHFPLFIFSDYYATNWELNAYEQQLLQAQVMSLRGEYSESVQIARNLEENALASSVQFGALCINAFNYILLGLYSELMECVTAMERICAQSTVHAEDYRLILAAIRFEYSYNVSALQRIDVSKLSPDALIAYECFILQATVLEADKLSDNDIRMYTAFCRRLEESGNIPAAVLSHGVMALKCEQAGNAALMQMHISDTCRLGHDNELYMLLAKCSALCPDAFRKALSRYGYEYANRIRNFHQQNLNSWKFVFGTARGMPISIEHSEEVSIILLLLSTGMTNKEIAKIKNIPEREVSDLVKLLCDEYGFKYKAQLISFAKKLFNHMDEEK